MHYKYALITNNEEPYTIKKINIKSIHKGSCIIQCIKTKYTNIACW